MINIDVQIKNSIHNDFYLQWEYIYWWQSQFNLSVYVEQIRNKVILN